MTALLDAVVITTGDYAYRRPDDGIAVIPARAAGSMTKGRPVSPDVEERRRPRMDRKSRCRSRA